MVAAAAVAGRWLSDRTAMCYAYCTGARCLSQIKIEELMKLVTAPSEWTRQLHVGERGEGEGECKGTGSDWTLAGNGAECGGGRDLIWIY